jgi:isopropylmalate/homocitrate/citramalate synthase
VVDEKIEIAPRLDQVGVEMIEAVIQVCRPTFSSGQTHRRARTQGRDRGAFPATRGGIA